MQLSYSALHVNLPSFALVPRRTVLLATVPLLQQAMWGRKAVKLIRDRKRNLDKQRRDYSLL